MFDTRGPMLRDFFSSWRYSGWLLSAFVAVLLVHFAEHAVQMWQIHHDHVARPMASAFLGLLWPWGVRTEVMHLGFAAFMLAGIAFFWPQFSEQAFDRQTRYQTPAPLFTQPWTWMSLTVVWQVAHLVEHGVLFAQWWTDRPRVGLFMDWTGVQRAEMHFTFTLVALLLMFRGLQLAWYHWGWSAPWTIQDTLLHLTRRHREHVRW